MTEELKKKIIWCTIGAVIVCLFIIAFISEIVLLSSFGNMEAYKIDKENFLIPGMILLAIVMAVMGYSGFLVTKRLIPMFKKKEDE